MSATIAVKPRRASPSPELRIVFRGKHAVAFQDTQTREIDIEGAIRSGKTTLCLHRELVAAREHPGIFILFARWTDTGVDGLIKPLWRHICDQAGIILDWHPDEAYDQLPNGSRVYFRGLKSQDATLRYSKFRGLTLSRVYVDQAEEIPQDVYLELAGRLSQSGFPHQITISPQSVDENHWIAKEFPNDPARMAKDANGKPLRSYVSLSIHDNAHNLPPEVIPALTRLYPPEHPKHKTMILGQRGMNVIGVPVYAGAFKRELHEGPVAYDPNLPLEEGIDFGKHHPCVIWRQHSPLGQVRYLGGILGQNLYLEDFLPIVLSHRGQWFPHPCEIKSCCDPAGASDNSQGVRDNGVSILRRWGFNPRWLGNSNAPDVRLAQVERHAALMRKRTANGEAFAVASDDRWYRISADATVRDTFLADGFEAGYVWDEHFVSVGSKQVRKPKKDGWFEHGQNCAEYLELNFGGQPLIKPVPQVPYRAPKARWQ